MDLRADLTRKYFELALPFDKYVSTGSDVEQGKWNAFYEQVALTAEQRTLIEGFNRQLNVLVLSGTWCGDCVRNCPMLQRVAEANSKIDLRFIDNRSNIELADHYRVQGGLRVPLAIFLSEDFFEVFRFGDRTLAGYRQKAEKEAGDACSIGLVVEGEEEQIRAEVSEWLGHVERSQLILQLSPMLRKRYGD